MLIDGEWVGAEETFQCVDPFTTVPWGRVPVASPGDVDRAVRAARRAFDETDWPRLPPQQRAAILRRLGLLIEEHADRLVHQQIRENGKLVSEMGPGIQAVAGDCHFYAGLAETLHGHTMGSPYPNFTTYTVREPIGVVAAITPWNTPLGLLGWKLFPALAAGNTVVAKPSEVTPTSTLLLAELAVEAGVPKGVLNVVTGLGPTGAALVEHPGRGQDRLHRLDGDRAAHRRHRGAARRTRLAGAGRQVPAGHLRRRRREQRGQRRHGGRLRRDGADLHGGLARARAGGRLRRVRRHARRPRRAACATATRWTRARSSGPSPRRRSWRRCSATSTSAAARPSCSRAAGDPDDPGFFVQPTVFGDVPMDARIAREEIFGPVASLVRFRDEEEALRIANDTAVRARRGRVDDERQARAPRREPRARRARVWINNYRLHGPRHAVRRLPAERARPRARHRGAARLHRGQERLDRHRQRRRPDLGLMRQSAVSYPRVHITEECMREGMQIESASISVDDKVRLLDALSQTGLKTIMVGSFVSPKYTPQMAEIDELMRALHARGGREVRRARPQPEGPRAREGVLAAAVARVDAAGAVHAPVGHVRAPQREHEPGAGDRALAARSSRGR